MAKEMDKPESVKPAAEIKKPIHRKFTLDKLRENSQELFGISPTVFDGAAYGLSGEFTVLEMKKIISEWLKREAK